MVRRSVVAVAVLVAVTVAGCSSGGGSDFTLPKFTRNDWTPAGLATARATVAKVQAAVPGQCVDASVADFSGIAFGMQQVRSTIVPTAQMTCNVNDEVVEISVFANRHDRDRFVDDRSSGLCRLAAKQDTKHKNRPNFPGLRWAVGAGDVTVQPDSESLARRLATATGGSYVPRACDNGVHADWNSSAINALDALGTKMASAGHGCGFVDLVERQSLPTTQSLSDAQLPVAIGNCVFDGASVQIITWARSTRQVERFVADRVKAACAGDPALGRIDGDRSAILAAGTVAEQVQTVIGGKLAATSCG